MLSVKYQIYIYIYIHIDIYIFMYIHVYIYISCAGKKIKQNGIKTVKKIYS